MNLAKRLECGQLAAAFGRSEPLEGGLRILAITNMYPTPARPGQGVFVEQQIQGLRAIGLKVKVVFLDRRRDGPGVYLGLERQVRQAIAEFNPHVLHVMYGGLMAWRVACRCHAAPLVVTFHGSDLLGENLSGLVRKFISRYGVHCSRRAARAADWVIVVARHLLGALRGWVPAEKVQVIPCGIDLDQFKPRDPALCRKQLGWDPARFHVVFASSNGDPVKRPDLAQAAVQKLNGHGINSELHWLSGVPNADVPVWLSASDSLLLTSMHEGSPTIVKEALACGLPIVSVPVGDVAERIAGLAGCHLAEPDPADLARKLKRVRDRGARLKCEARLAELSHLQIARRLRQCYAELCP